MMTEKEKNSEFADGSEVEDQVETDLRGEEPEGEQSERQTIENEVNEEHDEHDGEIQDDDSEETEENEINKLKDMLLLEHDKYLRLMAEYDNYRRRTMAEYKTVVQQANERIILKLLGVLDDFDRLFQQDVSKENFEGILEGMKLIHKKFFELLSAEGVKQIECLDQPFDAEKFDAIAQISDTSKPDGLVLAEAEKGYYLGEKIIRHPKVVVNQIDDSPEEDKNSDE